MLLDQLVGRGRDNSHTRMAVSVLGLIPAVIGGLFGMNLIDNPWPITLPQVAWA